MNDPIKTNKPLTLTLDSDAFNAFKAYFHMILNSTLSTMQQKDVEDASITVKFDIILQQLANPNVDAPESESEREITAPTFKHKVTAAMKIKSEKKGYVGGPDYELIWDKEERAWVMQPIKKEPTRSNGQTSMFDDDDYRYEEDHDE